MHGFLLSMIPTKISRILISERDVLSTGNSCLESPKHPQRTNDTDDCYIDPFTKSRKLVHNGRFPKFEVMYCSQNTVKLIKIQYNLSYKVQCSKSQNSDELKSCKSFWTYPPLWTSLLVAVYDGIENPSIVSKNYEVLQSMVRFRYIIVTFRHNDVILSKELFM